MHIQSGMSRHDKNNHKSLGKVALPKSINTKTEDLIAFRIGIMHTIVGEALG